MWKFVSSLIFTLAILGSSSVNASPEDHFNHLPKGGRRSLHGMVIFGSGPFFLEHIPMLTPPHDFQIITEVRLTDENGKPVLRSFAAQGFTLKPAENFSLNDYVAGRLRDFSGSIHQGSFEQGGEILPGLGKVSVKVIEYKLVRQLPSASADLVFRLSDGVHTFESNIIRPQQNVQLIRNATTGKELWCVKGPDFFDPCL